MSIIQLVFVLIALLMVIGAFFPNWNFQAGPVISPNRLIALLIGLLVLFVVYLIVVALFGTGSAKLISTFYAQTVSPIAVNPMDANAIALIGVPVVALTQLAKWANLPDQWGPAAVLVFAALGIAVWVASYGGFHQTDLFNYFVAWITTAVASAGVFGFTRAAASAVTRTTPPSASAAGGSPTTP